MLINSAIDKPRTCQQIKLTFQQIIKYAINEHSLPDQAYRTICENIELPKYHPKEKRPLTPLEKEALKTVDFSSRERAFLYILYGCGLRRGEALALRKEDISLKNAQLTVRRALEFAGNNPSIKGTKSFRGFRTVPMPPYLTDYLKKYLGEIKGDYLFSGQNSEQITKSNYRRIWESILKKMNLAVGGTSQLRIISDLTAHIFRHNYCTELCYQIPEISTKKIAQLLGDNEKMVLDVYSHVVEEKEKTSEVIASTLTL